MLINWEAGVILMRKDDQINFRISHDDKVMLMQAAQADGKSISEWLIDLGKRRIAELQSNN